MLAQLLPDRKSRGKALAATGMAALLTPWKGAALGLFARAVFELEGAWREAHPEFHGSLLERWRLALEQYDAQHQDPKNRAMHLVGIPLIAGGAVGLLASPTLSPGWFVSAAAFGSGWALSLTGHALFERNAPDELGDDPLSVVAGPVSDAKNLAASLVQRLRRGRGAAQPAMAV
jgi:hypothetical protein